MSEIQELVDDMTNKTGRAHKIGVKRSRSTHLADFKEKDSKNKKLDEEENDYELNYDENIMYALSHNQVLHNNDFKDFAGVESRNTYNVRSF